MSPQNWIRQGDVPRVMIPIAIFPRLVLGLPAARVYAALAMRANNTTGLVDSTREQIAEDSGLSVTQVKSGLRLLIEHGWITRERQGNGRTSSKHRMHASPVVSPAETVVEGGGNPTPSGSENNPPEGRETDRVGNPPPRGAETRPEGGGNPPPLLSIQSTCLSKDLSNGGTTYLRADADASRGDKGQILQAEIVDQDTSAAESFLVVVNPTPAPTESKPKKPRKPRAPKPADPAVTLRQEQAHDLADRYYRAKNGMVKFLAVRAIVLKALANYPYDAVFEGVKHMATADRDRPFTLDTLRAGIERAHGVSAPSGAPRLSTGDRRVVEAELTLKSQPDWDLLARLGVTPANAHHFGYRSQRLA